MFMFNNQYFDVNVTYLSIFNNAVVCNFLGIEITKLSSIRVSIETHFI